MRSHPARVVPVLLLSLLLGCSNVRSKWDRFTSKFERRTETPAQLTVQRMEQAHGAAAWRAKQALSADLVVEADGEQVLHGTLTFAVNGGRSRIDLSAGATLVYDGERAWLSPAATEFPNARFHLLTWPYLASAPFRLRDPGAIVTESGTLPLGGREVPVLRLTFAPGAGASPDTWYVLYPDPENGRLRAMTNLTAPAKGSVTEGADAPRAMVSTDEQTVDGVTLATRHTFYTWSMDGGIAGDPVGRAVLKNVQFVEPPEGFFARPADAREDAGPTTRATTVPTSGPTTAATVLTSAPTTLPADDAPSTNETTTTPATMPATTRSADAAP